MTLRQNPETHQNVILAAEELTSLTTVN